MTRNGGWSALLLLLLLLLLQSSQQQQLVVSEEENNSITSSSGSSGSSTSSSSTTTSTESSAIYYTEPNYASSNSLESGYRGLTELAFGRVLRNQRVLERAKSPYVLRQDLVIEADAQLVIEPGVEVRFAPMIGITVRGLLKAEVST
ncbi:protein bark beetle-like [Trichogramma pretiosum]|uniref:protein bark beetle-like n=1 Tax=Trichogramma pretiosum TaxID=7493 RepID=UPI000C71ACB8|nr:protein bark beetle-like [Trichogramma pretiosum]